MKKKIKLFCLIITVSIFSCKNQSKKSDLLNPEKKEIVKKEKEETNEETFKLNKFKIIEKLQGRWEENEYPYRTAEFVNSTVKFIEEGTVAKPQFEKFDISQSCQFDNSNIKDLKSNDMILTLPEENRCEKLTVSKDTLVLYGYSTNTNDKYEIIYLKTKN